MDWSRTVYSPAESSDLFLILGCMTSNFLYLSFSTLCSSSLWRTDTIVFVQLNKPPPPATSHKSSVSIKPLPHPPPLVNVFQKINPLELRIYGKCKGENVQEYGYKQTHLFWLTLRQRSNGSQALDKKSKEEMLLSSSLSSLNKTQFVSWGGCKRRHKKKSAFLFFHILRLFQLPNSPNEGKFSPSSTLTIRDKF